MQKGHHLLVDCRNVARELCSNDAHFLDVMARAASRAGMHVISQIRYKFGQDSPPGFTAIVMLDESHVSAHTYADLGLIAMDVFTCGSTDRTPDPRCGPTTSGPSPRSWPGPPWRCS